MDEKKVRSIVFGCLFLANRTTFLCAGCVPVVFALATSVHAFRLDTPDERLDNQHYSHLLCLAPAPLDAWLDWLRMTRSAAPQASADGTE